MSEITVMCPHCGAALTGDSDFLGEEVGCPDCGNDFVAENFSEFFEGSESAPAGEESISARLKKFRLDPSLLKKGGSKSFLEDDDFEPQPSNDSVFTDTERGVKRPAAYRYQNSTNPGARRPAVSRRQSGKAASSSGTAAPASPAKRPVPVSRKKKSFDLLIAREGGSRIFRLDPWFWIFFSLGTLLLGAGVFNVLYAPGYEGEFKDWGGSVIYQPNSGRRGEALIGESALVAAKNTVVICEGLKHINRNISNIGTHYQGMHEMIVGFTLMFGSGFFFFCALISFLYSARLPAKE